MKADKPKVIIIGDGHVGKTAALMAALEEQKDKIDFEIVDASTFEIPKHTVIDDLKLEIPSLHELKSLNEPGYLNRSGRRKASKKKKNKRKKR